MAERKVNYEKGTLELSALQERHLDWLTKAVDRPEDQTKTDWAAELGVATSTLRKWERDGSFVREWETRVKTRFTLPEILQSHLGALNKAAGGGDVQAIKLYWQLIGQISPDRFAKGAADKDAAEMSDEELAASLESAAAELRAS